MFGKVFLRAFAVGGMLLGLTAAGLAVPSSSPLGTPEASAACSSFKRAKVLNKREILTQAAYGELRNSTSTKQMLVLETKVSVKKTTTATFSREWSLFEGAMKSGVSVSVAIEHGIERTQQVRVDVNPHRTFAVIGYARSWWVETEVTERNSNCEYKTRKVSGEVATTDDAIWRTRDIGGA